MRFKKGDRLERVSDKYPYEFVAWSNEDDEEVAAEYGIRGADNYRRSVEELMFDGHDCFVRRRDGSIGTADSRRLRPR